ncbi:hypothetical protein TRIUR3_16886 [Triticum urartu]|uniref:Cysteine-rich PDZ-binding protein n=2 Tax=Triticum TaxID=4564 RepID=A0A9R0Z446_TRITD|nr:hypothetical protein TRIUR3_16886 [Triticum urartu]VAI71000.1 unnamed protein product [Triticum turgidum subsp. durum]
MVCTKCEKKLGKVIVPDKWKEGASNTYEGGGRKINENKLLSKKSSCTKRSFKAGRGVKKLLEQRSRRLQFLGPLAVVLGFRSKSREGI